MHVLLMGPYPPPHGGVQTNMVAIRRRLLEKGIPCSVINLTRHRGTSEDNVYFPRGSMEVLRLLFTLRCDVIHLHFGGMLTPRLLGLALVCTLLPRTRTVLTFHSGGYPESEAGKQARRRSLAGFVFRRIDKLIGVNESIVRLFAKLGVPETNAELIEPFSEASDAEAATLSPEIARFIESHSPVLTSVGLLEPEYDLETQIDLLGRIRKSYPKAGLLIIGSGSLEDELRARINTKAYASEILLAGDVSHAVTLSSILASDVFLRTTWYDGDSISVREALHLGVPVIATENGMRPPGVTLVPVGDRGALLNAISRIIDGERVCQPIARTERDNIEAVIRLYSDISPEPQTVIAAACFRSWTPVSSRLGQNEHASNNRK